MNSSEKFKYFFIVMNLFHLSWNSFVSGSKETSVHSQDQKLTGDLYYVQGTNIHSLVWVIKLSSNCNIRQILSECCFCSDHLQTLFNKGNYSLIILKKLEPFVNTYLIAHPYYRMYKKVKRKLRKNYRKFILLRNSFIDRRISVTNNDLHQSTHFLSVSDAEVFYKTEKCVLKFLKSHPCIEIIKQEILYPRSKRLKVEFDDPLYRDQWHLKNNASGEYDVNVIGAWESGITGHGVTVCVIDDGLEWRHPDLKDNYNPRGSYDLNADDFDPSPVRNGEKNEHGTRCAGEIAAVANHVCGVGVAYRANISGIRVLGERMTDSMEAAAFIQGLSVNDVYSCSWGPNDDGKTVDGPHYLAKKALVHGITYGRNGYGAIYVVASGNGGKNKDNCNFDGYANSVYTVTIGAVDSKGTMPYYAEECATMLAVAPSSGSNGKAIVTTDWQGSSKSGCTSQHTGTSAAAPLAAAVIALALEMQSCLSWRDVQYLIALTSRKIDTRNSDWIVNKAGLHHSHQHGFGLMDATGIVSAAAVWESVPFLTTFRSNLMVLNKEIPSLSHQKLIVNRTIEEDLLNGYALHLLEFVQVYVTLEHEFRGSLKISLTCPSGTKSILASPRINDKLVRRALKGEVIHVNRSLLCHVPETNFAPFSPLSEQTVKILVISSVFVFLMAIYNTIEYILCYNSEKKKFYQHLKDLIHSRTLMLSSRLSMPSATDQDESLTLLELQMDSQIQNDDDANDSFELPANDLYRQEEEQQQRFSLSSPTPSCEADVSSLNADSDDDNDTISSRNTSDTVVPRDTDVTTTTDFTTDHTTSEADELDRKFMFREYHS